MILWAPWSIKRPVLLNVLAGPEFLPKVSINRLGLSQVLRASVYENQGFSILFEKVFLNDKYFLNFKS